MYNFTLQSDEGPIRSGSHNGTQYFGGVLNQRYTIRVHNTSYQRVEAVVTIDGLSVIDGEPGSYASRGMLIPAHGSADFDGWRTSLEGIAAFRIVSPTETYANVCGDPANAGIIGLAIFAEKQREVYRGGMPSPRPASVTRGGASKGAGTAFGEHHASHVRMTEFDRASTTPTHVQTFRYDTIIALIEAGIFAAEGDGPQAFPGNPSGPAFCKPA